MKKVLTLLILFFLPLIILPTAVFAQTDREQKNVVLPKTETVNKDYFAAGDTVTVSGTVNGDAYIAGGTVFVDGVINGDLLVAGGTVHVRGPVKNDIRAAGGTVTIDSTVGGNITIAGGTVTITDPAKITGSLVGASGTLSLFGTVGKGATIGAGDLTLGNKIGGDVTAGIGQLTFTNGASIQGNLDYWGEKETKLPKDASISGKVSYHPSENKYNYKPEAAPKEVGWAFTGFAFTFKLFEIISAFIIGALLIRFFPIYIKRSMTTITTKPWHTLFIGILSFAVTPIVIILLFVSLIGVPLALVLSVLYAILLYFGKIFAALFVGVKILNVVQKSEANFYLAMIIGLIALAILMLIPFIGWVVIGVLFFMGLGTLILGKKEYYLELRSKKII